MSSSTHMGSTLFFSTFEVSKQAFHRTALSYAIVNLKPLVPGHVLVIPRRPVPRLSDLTPPELTSLMSSVQQVGRVIEKAYGADALTIACQDGVAAGQSVPHVHFHILPRKTKGDRFSGRNDDVYPELEKSEGDLPQSLRSNSVDTTAKPEPLKVDAEEDRKPRTNEEMETEAKCLEELFAGQNST